MKILTINAGSSSLKFQIFSEGNENFRNMVKGQIDGIGSHPHLKIKHTTDGNVVNEDLNVKNLPEAIEVVEKWIKESHIILEAVGHRVVHGGPDFS